MTEMSDYETYDLSGPLDVDRLRAVPPGASLLISGPAMTGKDDLLRGFLADGLAGDEAAVAVTTGGPAEGVIDDIHSRAEFEGHALSAIDSRAEGSRESQELGNGSHVHRVSDPADLTSIGVCVTEALERVGVGGYDRGRFGLTSLSTMLTYTDEKTVFKFCHVLSSRLEGAGFVGLYTIDESAHDQQTLQVLKQNFDGQVQLREQGGTRQVRARGFGGDPTAWQAL
ncbi:MAG: KaiC/GvpD/RAD55 family RecA-like ATPase [Natronomonas sp.]|jgi:KaiC/GvpD/RAD55 family RecA-like ATPase